MGAWGYGLFQSDHDFDLVSELSHEAGLDGLEEAARARAKAAGTEEKEDIYLSIYGQCCHDPELVRTHLDSGVLVRLIQQKEDKLLSEPKLLNWRDPCYSYVLLGACAMTLGCQLPGPYIKMLKKVYTEGGLMPDALRQMRKALFGPGGYQNGVPYDFGSLDIVETANARSAEDDESNRSGFTLMNVLSPHGLFNTGMGDSTTSTVIKELRDKHNNPDACGGCGKKQGKSGKPLLQCAKCRDRKYCGAECQKSHWKVHKKVCEPVEK